MLDGFVRAHDFWSADIVPSEAGDKVHLFLDEAGDTTFFAKGGLSALGHDGVSLAFGVGWVRFAGGISELRRQVVALQTAVEQDDYLNVLPSVRKRRSKGAFFFHAKDDAPEVRERLFRWIRQTDCEFEMILGRKIPSLFIRKHHGRDAEFYADLLSHLIRQRPATAGRRVLNVAERGATTRNATLELALAKAREREETATGMDVVFNVQNPRTEPLLAVPDYLAWAVQRVFERGETRHYEFVRERIRLVRDLYGGDEEGEGRVYHPEQPLTAQNKLSPPAS